MFMLKNNGHNIILILETADFLCCCKNIATNYGSFGPVLPYMPQYSTVLGLYKFNSDTVHIEKERNEALKYVHECANDNRLVQEDSKWFYVVDKIKALSQIGSFEF